MSVHATIFNNTFREKFDTATANTTAVAAGIRLFGHRYVGGYEPNWFTDVRENVLDCTTLFYVYSDNIDAVAFSYAQAMRRNVVRGGMNLSIDFVWDSVADSNAFLDGYCAYAGKTFGAGSTQYNYTSPGLFVR